MNLNELVVAIFSCSKNMGDDLSVSESKVRNNIRWGKEVDLIGEVPKKYNPDWDKLYEYQIQVGVDEFSKRWAEMNEVRRNNYLELVELFSNKDYEGMVKLMEKSSNK